MSDLIGYRRTVEFGSQVACNSVTPERLPLEPVELMGECGLGHCQVMDQDRPSEDKHLRGGKWVAWSGDEINHLPKRIKVGNVVDREKWEISWNLGAKSRCPLSEVHESGLKALPARSVVIISLGSERPLPDVRQLITV